MYSNCYVLNCAGSIARGNVIRNSELIEINNKRYMSKIISVSNISLGLLAF